MNRRLLLVAVAALAVVGFVAAAFLYDRSAPKQAASRAIPGAAGLVRAHSPVMGPANARVTIVEFFDPACEACRAFYPFVKQIMAQHPNDVRLVLRYAAFHPGSEEAIRILETARLQNVFPAVLEALLAEQRIWASHSAPGMAYAWEIAGTAGLNVEKARQDSKNAQIEEALRQDAADIKTFEVKGTPTFYINGKPLLTFGPRQLYEMVLGELGDVRDNYSSGED
jgi:protein-disulfide isomerase